MKFFWWKWKSFSIFLNFSISLVYSHQYASIGWKVFIIIVGPKIMLHRHLNQQPSSNLCSCNCKCHLAHTHTHKHIYNIIIFIQKHILEVKCFISINLWDAQIAEWIFFSLQTCSNFVVCPNEPCMLWECNPFCFSFPEKILCSGKKMNIARYAMLSRMDCWPRNMYTMPSLSLSLSLTLCRTYYSATLLILSLLLLLLRKKELNFWVTREWEIRGRERGKRRKWTVIITTRLPFMSFFAVYINFVDYIENSFACRVQKLHFCKEKNWSRW
jgi:hypothetical protein